MMNDHLDLTPEEIDAFRTAELTPEDEARLRRSFANALSTVDTFLALPVTRPETGDDVLRTSLQIRASKIAGRMRAGINSMMEARGWSQ